MFSHIKELFTRPSGYQISRSVRLRRSASAYLNRTLGSGNRQTWTWSKWIKRANLTDDQFAFHTFGAGGFGVQGRIILLSNYTLDFIFDYNGGSQWRLTTTQVFRDPSAWYHIVVVADTTNATSGDRLRMYVNGIRVTSFSSANYPTQNANGTFNQAYTHAIGADTGAAGCLDGYLTEVNFIDGQALTPSSFGETNAVTGVWQPKRYAGTYGTNGFYLNFSDNSGVTATTIGKDYSGNGNNWTPNNISITAGVTYDSMIDVPTNYDDGTVYDRGNYPVINPLNNSGGTTIADGNLKVTWGSASSRSVLNTMAIPASGKFYAEFVVGTLTSASVAASFGLATESVARTSDGYGASGAWVYYASNQSYISRNGTSSAQIGSNQTFAAGGIVQVAVDRTNNQAWLGYNNVWVNATNGTDGNPSAGTNPTVSSLPADLFIIMGLYANSGNVNFGQRPFTYTPPTGFVALNTQNLPTPTISNGATVMAATTYTGTGSAMSVSNAVNNVSFQPDWVWIKQRNNAANHVLADAIRGVDKYVFSNLTNAEATATAGTGITAFNSNGFSLGTETSTVGSVNAAGGTGTYVAWQWNAGGSTVTNTSGSISSQVRASTTAGFSVVTYTGTGANATVGHGLGVAPSMVIVKKRATTQNWIVWHSGIPATDYLYLNLTNAKATGAWNSTAPSSTVFSVDTAAEYNSNAATYVAYCFAAVAGYSAFGSYTGNGSADGPFVFTGFRPRFVMTKRTDSTGGWVMLDSARDSYNVSGNILQAESSAAELAVASYPTLDILSNGFKIRSSTIQNASGGTYIYAAFSEVGFKYALGR